MNSWAEADRNAASLEAKTTAAFLGAAVGDALGWPWERRVRHAGGRAQERAFNLVFEEWTKRSGGRFMPHEERIRAGEYSDDTQLILCLARSVAHHRDWWRDFAFVELPLWTLYERGGGGATKRAAAALVSGKLPWDVKRKDAERYFQAGGNGVAMRVLPNVVAGARDDGFSGTAWSVLAQGVTTHGHPRAIVGALAHAYALRFALTSNGILGYGQLVSEVLAGAREWGALPNVKAAWEGWERAANSLSGADYRQLWDKAVGEMIGLLETCKEGMSRGALAIDRDVMERLGCFDPRQNGAGTVGVAAAIFLASRYAASPANGVICAATAVGADTDTIASMTGSLLGAIAGCEWIGPALRDLQDEAHIRETALRTVRLADNHPPRRPIRQRELDAFSAFLPGQGLGITMPDGRLIVSIQEGPVTSRAPGMGVNSFLVRTDDGQVLYLKKLFRRKMPPPELPFVATLPPREEIVRVSIQVPTRDLARAKHFYSYVLGLPVLKETTKTVNFGALTLRLSEDASTSDPGAGRVVVFIEMKGLEKVKARLEDELGRDIPLAKISPGAKLLRVADPDGHNVELVQRDGA